MSNTPDLKKASDKELQKMLTEARLALHNLRFEVSNTQLKNVRDIRVAKKHVAVLLTEIHARKTDKKS